ncbi:MAG: type II toxin-antitoxin system VapC family toxin [Acidimicrobiia bacterium]
MAEVLIVDASAMVDLLVGSPLADSIQARLRGHELHVPAHFDAEVLSVLGRLHGGGHLTVRQVNARLQRIAAAPIQWHALPPLLAGAWRRRHNLRLVDGLYVELGNELDASIVATDAVLASASPVAEQITDVVPSSS